MARAFASGMGAAFMATLGFVAFIGLVAIAARGAWNRFDAKIGRSIRSIPLA